MNRGRDGEIQRDSENERLILIRKGLSADARGGV